MSHALAHEPMFEQFDAAPAEAEIHHLDVADGYVHTQAEPQDATEFNPIAALFRAMRGRWLTWFFVCLVFAPIGGAVGFLNGAKLYESQAILRIYPKEQNVLYTTRDDSVLKTLDAFVRAEMTFVASHPVMARALELLTDQFPEEAAEVSPRDLANSIEIRLRETMIVLTTVSKSPEFAAAKLDAVTSAYLELTDETNRVQNTTRINELMTRETDLLQRLQELNTQMLEVGGEFGPDAMAKAHIEKIAQIDALAGRRGEVEATLVSMRSSGNSSADMNDDEIMRATLLDRALADLNFEKAKLEADLARARTRYTDAARQVRDLLEEIAVIDRAMADRRQQIQVLGQTGALTDQSGASTEQSIADIEALLEKVTARLEAAREEARDLNARRLQLGFLAAERDDVQDMLEQTRRALDEVVLESDNALPGLTELMVPPVVPQEAAEDSSKMLGAGGFLGGGFLGTLAISLMAARNRKLRFSDATWATAHLVPVLSVITRKTERRDELMGRAIDKLRNKIMLMPVRTPVPEGRGKILAVAQADRGSAASVSRTLAESFARARLSVLLVDADPINGQVSRLLGADTNNGWCQLVAGGRHSITQVDGFELLPIGQRGKGEDSNHAAQAVRKSLGKLAANYDVVVVDAGSLEESVSAELVLSASDVGIGCISPNDRSEEALKNIPLLDSLPRNGGALVMTKARKNDPGL
ncbi:MAG: hypothetical protein AAFQ36_10970 [Pseudomonadota bacterium]